MERNLPHIRINSPSNTCRFTSPQSGGKTTNLPERDRLQHGNYLKTKLLQVWQKSENEIATECTERQGTYIEFESAPGFDIAFKSLEDIGKGIRLCNVRSEKQSLQDGSLGDVIYVTVYVPNSQKEIFFNKIEKYLTINTKNNNPRNQKLLEGIEELRKALLIESFWTDDKSLVPTDTCKEWCEVWIRESNEESLSRFNQLLVNLNIESKAGIIRFPERVVKLIFASRLDLCNLSKYSDEIAEYRKGKNTAYFLLSQTPSNQSEWVSDFLKRLSFVNESNVSICLLDTGVNNGHPLLSPLLDDSDCHAVIPDWKVHDHHKHGTLMAGIAGYGNLQEKIESNDSITINHCLESVKILPPEGANPVELWGDITKQAVSRAEIQSKDRKRIVCMAITAKDTRDRGRPSSWSAAIDQLISGSEDGERRLFFVAAGNNADKENWENYPESNMTDSIHDPAQSWNAITVGAVTQLQEITESSLDCYSPIAKQGELSPFTTTSMTWENKWPIKPDVVFEGGNLAVDNTNFITQCDDLSLVSTFYKPTENMLSPFNMTSAATAQAAYFAAKIQAVYPDYWPETIRGLIIHSAKWPEGVKKQLINKKNKNELIKVLRACGYGKPDLSQALYCASNNLTLIAQYEIEPFEKNGGDYKTKDMHLYELPWPKDVLENLGEADVQMRITLSYFIEPGPGEVGWDYRYKYSSHGLRFELNSPEEDIQTFTKRINKSFRKDETDVPDSKSPSGHWIIGSNNRDKGSIHSDIWKGTAVELASSNLVAVLPCIGWWRERHNLKKYNKKTRYSLIISISTPSNDVDLYTPIHIELSEKITIPTKLCV